MPPTSDTLKHFSILFVVLGYSVQYTAADP